jgi:hypothetical protein
LSPRDINKVTKWSRYRASLRGIWQHLHHAAAACNMVNLSYFEGKLITRAAALKGIWG